MLCSASVATLIRLKFLADLNDTSDILCTPSLESFWSRVMTTLLTNMFIVAGTDAMVWTLVEPGVAITAASLATIRPLLRRLRVSGFLSTERSFGTIEPRSRSQRLKVSTGRSVLRSATVMDNSLLREPDQVALIDMERGKKDELDGSIPSEAPSWPRQNALVLEKKVRVHDGAIPLAFEGLGRKNTLDMRPALVDSQSDIGIGVLDRPRTTCSVESARRRSEMYIIEGAKMADA